MLSQNLFSSYTIQIVLLKSYVIVNSLPIINFKK